MKEIQSNTMDIKLYLRRYTGIKKKIKILEQDIKDIDAEIDGLKAQIISDMPKGSGGFRSIEEQILLKKTDMMMFYQEQKYKAECIKEDIERAIASVPDETEQIVLRNKYIHGMTWERVCVEMNYSWNGIHKIHRKALHHITIQKRV